MSFILPLLLAGALASPATSFNSNVDDKIPRVRRVTIDTAAHRRVVADLVVRAKVAAEGGSLNEARAQLLVANMMMRESGGLETVPVYNLVHINYALDRYVEAADLLIELSEEALKKGNPTLAATAAVDAAELYMLGERRPQAVESVVRVRKLINDARVSDTVRDVLRKRLG
ncbi:MAG: hypothetical protein H7Z40_00330 [Phycisphaerae bacterium]|nr:hypothetical protein [Gemmatimonadaceae bacterium]